MSEHTTTIDDATAWDDEAIQLIADIVTKCADFGEQDGDFVACYVIPTGPIHRAIPWLQERGLVTRPNGVLPMAFQASFGAAIAKAVDAARAQRKTEIVAFIRAHAGDANCHDDYQLWTEYADMIERGELG